MTLSTYEAHSSLKDPEASSFHPTLLHVVRKTWKGRIAAKEPVPNLYHFQQDFMVIDRNLYIINKTSNQDDGRGIEPRNFLFTFGSDMTIPLGNHPDSLNLIILLPKTEKRSSPHDLTLRRMVEYRTSDKSSIQFLMDKYSGKNSANVRKVRIKLDLYPLRSGNCMGTCLSNEIVDSVSKNHGSLDLLDVSPLRTCARGGRKIIMIAEFRLSKDILPQFQLLDTNGARLDEEEAKF